MLRIRGYFVRSFLVGKDEKDSKKYQMGDLFVERKFEIFNVRSDHFRLADFMHPLQKCDQKEYHMLGGTK